MFGKQFITLAALALGVLGAPTSPDERIADKYIVVYKDDISESAIQAHKSQVSGFMTRGFKATGKKYTGFKHNYNIGNTFKGYSGHFDHATVEDIKKSADVKYVTPVIVMKALDLPNINKRQEDTVKQESAPWGLARSSSAEAGSTTYTYKSHGGEGSTVYVVDTGIDIEHKDFGGRATWGHNTVDDDDTDGNGHGTHCAGTIGGETYGIAKKAKLVAVKVLDAGGSGTNAGVIEGMNWAGAEGAKAGKAVLSMSLGGAKDKATDDAVKAIVESGVAVVVAAGNESQDADNVSPASAPGAICVGATDDADKVASFSNFGKALAVWAPGVDVTSAAPGGGEDTMSGTSMACPHVAGMAAYFMAEGSDATNVLEAIQNNALKAITDSNGSTDLLLNNGLGGSGGNATVNFF